MSVMNIEFERFVKLAGGRTGASQIMNCQPSLVSMIRSGKRDVSKEAAKAIIARYPEISLYGLLYPEQAA